MQNETARKIIEVCLKLKKEREEIDLKLRDNFDKLEIMKQKICQSGNDQKHFLLNGKLYRLNFSASYGVEELEIELIDNEKTISDVIKDSLN